MYHKKLMKKLGGDDEDEDEDEDKKKEQDKKWASYSFYLSSA